MSEAMPAALRDELAAANVRRLVDPRTIPVRFFHLHAMGASPAHCLAAFQDERDSTLSMRLGTGAHALLLGGKDVAVYPGKVRRGKEYDAFVSAHPFATILNAKEHTKAQAMSASVRANEDASLLLFGPNVRREETIHWDWSGRRCRSTPDAFGPHHLVEIKTTRCAEPGRFQRDATWRAYHGQLAWYRTCLRESQQLPVTSAYIIAVESVAPYAVTVLKLTERALERGEQLVRLWWERLAVCEQSGQWPAYCQSIAEFDVPDDEVELTFADDTDEGDDE